MNELFSINEQEAGWEEARLRIRIYLRALNLGEEDCRHVTEMVTSRLAARYGGEPQSNPTALAMDEVRDLCDSWFEKMVPGQGRASVRGLVSHFAMDGSRRWPGTFLRDQVPAEFQRALQTSEVRGAPDLRVSRMVPQPFDSPLRDITLPNALAQLTKDLSPSLVARAIGLVISWLSIWTGNRMR
jgi:hypothetical protein